VRYQEDYQENPKEEVNQREAILPDVRSFAIKRQGYIFFLTMAWVFAICGSYIILRGTKPVCIGLTGIWSR